MRRGAFEVIVAGILVIGIAVFAVLMPKDASVEPRSLISHPIPSTNSVAPSDPAAEPATESIAVVDPAAEAAELLRRWWSDHTTVCDGTRYAGRYKFLYEIAGEPEFFATGGSVAPSQSYTLADSLNGIPRPTKTWQGNARVRVTARLVWAENQMIRTPDRWGTLDLSADVYHDARGWDFDTSRFARSSITDYVELSCDDVTRRLSS